MHHFKTRVLLHYNGRINWFAPTIIKTTCHVDAKHYPFDRQNCSLVFGSWTYDGLEIDIYPKEGFADTALYLERGDFDLIGVKSKRNVKKYEYV